MKTFYLLAFCFWIQLTSQAQFHSYQLDELEMQTAGVKNDCDRLKPVYYNFTKRRLYTSNKTPLNGAHFLELCRGINDPNINYQIRKYDELSSRKKKLVAATIVCGVAGYLTLMTSAISASSSFATDAPYIGMGIGGVALIATPFLAISTSIPHQKRKEILFRDLPEAYNFYVTSQQ